LQNIRVGIPYATFLAGEALADVAEASMHRLVAFAAELRVNIYMRRQLRL
jgi:hypothetical protein